MLGELKGGAVAEWSKALQLREKINSSSVLIQTDSKLKGLSEVQLERPHRFGRDVT